MNTSSALGREDSLKGIGVSVVSDLGLAVVIEDDDDVRNLLDAVLRQAGFVVHSSGGGREGVELVRDKLPGVVTIDVGLPDIDGFEVLRQIRKFSTAYVVMLTGRASESDMLTGFQGGADDYIIKPFRPLELRARLSAMMRRTRDKRPGGWPAASVPMTSAPSAADGEDLLQHNGLTLDYAGRAVTVDRLAVALTRSEFELLHDVLRAGGTIRTRPDLVRVLRREDYGEPIEEANERAVEVHMGNLRRKLGDKPGAPRWMLTVRGIGYRLAPVTRQEQIAPAQPTRI